MKKIYFFIACFLLLNVHTKAQAPNSINYQGVARNTSGVVLPNQNISLRFSIHQGSVGGTVVYQETKAATTNQLGLFTVAIGSGTVVSGSFSAIDWAANTEYLQVEMDPTGGTSYLNMGTNQFLSVPYSLYADSSGASSASWNTKGNANTTPASNYIGTTNANDFVIKTNGAERVRVTSTGGILIPRQATNPASPSESMMYFNTTSGCFMFYNGSSWQAIVCGCPNTPPAPGSITGSATFCTNQTGVSYSVAPVSVATGYTWTVPSGDTIVSGQGSNAIKVNFGTTSGNITVSATNNCATGASSALAVVDNTPAFTSQPASPSPICGTGTASFTVGAGSGVFQWQENTGSSWNNISNGGVYSGATSTTLTITNPPGTMNGYLYRAVITGTCGPTLTTDGTATLSVHSVKSVPITISNSQGSPTSANFQAMLTINFSTFSGNGENTNLNNVEFSTGAGGTGTPLYAWIENGSTATPATVPTSSSTNAIVWVNLGSTTVPANGSVTIYMSFMPSPVMVASSVGASTGYTGMAPQLTGTSLPTYGQYDNGALVFTNFYDNFAGTTLASKWTVAPSCSVTVSNAITSMSSPGHWYCIYTNTFTHCLNTVADAYLKYSNPCSEGIGIITNGVEDEFGGSSCGLNFGSGGTLTTSSTANQTQGGSVSANTFYVFTGIITNSPTLPIMQLNYVNIVTGNSACTTTDGAVGIGISYTNTLAVQWFRDRQYPPSGTMPTASVGAYGCY